MEQHPKYIQDFYQHELDRGLTANTVIHYHANIRKCLQYAFQIGMIRSNPADRVERPRKEKFKSEIYSGEELEQLFKVIQGDPSEFGVIMAAFYGLHSFPAGLSSGSMRKNAAPETEVHNFHTGMLYFTGGSVLY